MLVGDDDLAVDDCIGRKDATDPPGRAREPRGQLAHAAAEQANSLTVAVPQHAAVLGLLPRIISVSSYFSSQQGLASVRQLFADRACRFDEGVE